MSEPWACDMCGRKIVGEGFGVVGGLILCRAGESDCCDEVESGGSVRRVLALHTRHAVDIAEAFNGKVLRVIESCGHCKHSWPCPTMRALRGDGS